MDYEIKYNEIIKTSDTFLNSLTNLMRNQRVTGVWKEPHIKCIGWRHCREAVGPCMGSEVMSAALCSLVYL